MSLSTRRRANETSEPQGSNATSLGITERNHATASREATKPSRRRCAADVEPTHVGLPDCSYSPLLHAAATSSPGSDQIGCRIPAGAHGGPTTVCYNVRTLARARS